MKNLLKYLGIFIILLGVILLLVYNWTDSPTNGLLVAAGLCVVAGAVGHIILNRVIE